MVYDTKVVLPCDIIHDSPRVRMYEEREAELDRQDDLDGLEEERDVAKARSAFYQQQAQRYQSREVRAKTYNVGELVLRLPEKKKDKLKPKWEGPFIIALQCIGQPLRAEPMKRRQTPKILRLSPDTLFIISFPLFFQNFPFFVSFTTSSL